MCLWRITAAVLNLPVPDMCFSWYSTSTVISSSMWNWLDLSYIPIESNSTKRECIFDQPYPRYLAICHLCDTWVLMPSFCALFNSLFIEAILNLLSAEDLGLLINCLVTCFLIHHVLYFSSVFLLFITDWELYY